MMTDEVSTEDLSAIARKVATDPKGLYSPTILQLKLVDCFTTLFCRWRFNNEDLIVQLFPRKGILDLWSEGAYLTKCPKCKTEKKEYQKKCERCGERGQYYRPGRAEVPGPTQFPANIRDLMQKSADRVWAGEVKVMAVYELGAFCLKFEGAGKSDATLVEKGLLDKFLSKLDEEIDHAPVIQVVRR